MEIDKNASGRSAMKRIAAMHPHVVCFLCVTVQ